MLRALARHPYHRLRDFYVDIAFCDDIPSSETKPPSPAARLGHVTVDQGAMSASLAQVLTFT